MLLGSRPVGIEDGAVLPCNPDSDWQRVRQHGKALLGDPKAGGEGGFAATLRIALAECRKLLLEFGNPPSPSLGLIGFQGAPPLTSDRYGFPRLPLSVRLSGLHPERKRVG